MIFCCHFRGKSKTVCSMCGILDSNVVRTDVPSWFKFFVFIQTLMSAFSSSADKVCDNCLGPKSGHILTTFNRKTRDLAPKANALCCRQPSPCTTASRGWHVSERVALSMGRGCISGGVVALPMGEGVVHQWGGASVEGGTLHGGGTSLAGGISLGGLILVFTWLMASRGWHLWGGGST